MLELMFFHLIAAAIRLHVKRKGNWNLIGIKDCVDMTIQGIEDATKMSEDKLITRKKQVQREKQEFARKQK